MVSVGEFLKWDEAVGDKVVGRNSGVVKHGEVEVDGIGHLSGEVLVPHGVEGLGLGGGLVYSGLVDVHRDVGVDGLVLRLAEGHVGAMPLLEVGRPQAARFADLDAHCAGEHSGYRCLSHLFSLVGCCHFALITTPRPTTSKATTVLAVASQTWLSAEGDNPWLPNSGAVLVAAAAAAAAAVHLLRATAGAAALSIGALTRTSARKPWRQKPSALHTDEADNDVYSAFYSGRVPNSMFDNDCGAPAAALRAASCRCAAALLAGAAASAARHQSRVGAGWRACCLLLLEIEIFFGRSRCGNCGPAGIYVFGPQTTELTSHLPAPAPNVYRPEESLFTSQLRTWVVVEVAKTP